MATDTNLNNVNCDEKFLQIRQDPQQDGAKLLLHVCCAPCATYCLTQVLERWDVTLYFANDNITDPAEWQKRLGEVQKLVELANSDQYETAAKFPLKLVVRPFDSQRFFDAARGLENQPEGGARCTECFRLRLADTAEYAASHGFEWFGTTLTVSPYKNSKLLNAIGMSLQSESLAWLPSDFKKRGGYNESIRLSQKYGLYRQHYCGCKFSDWQAKD